MRTKKGAALYYRTLKASFTRAIELEYIEKNPFVKVRLSKMEKSFPVFITESELEIIIGNTSNKFLRIYFSQLFILRMRLDELLRESDKGV